MESTSLTIAQAGGPPATARAFWLGFAAIEIDGTLAARTGVSA
jgi:hypothetical protein